MEVRQFYFKSFLLLYFSYLIFDFSTYLCIKKSWTVQECVCICSNLQSS